MYLLTRLFFLVLFLFSTHLAADEIVHTKWKLKDSLLKNEKKTGEQDSNHQIRFGYSSKRLAGLEVSSTTNTFSYESQNIPGGQIGYNYTFGMIGLTSSFYTNAGFYTRYNDLGALGYADLSVMDFFAGFSLGYSLFKNVKLTPNVFAGAGHSYYFQRGDSSTADADKRIFEAEYGAGLDIALPNKDAYPDSWSGKYIISLRYSVIETLNNQNALARGEKISASFGVQL